MDNRDRFHEANILLSNTLKQLDEVMGKSTYQESTVSPNSTDIRLSSSMHGRINGFNGKSPPLLSDDYTNGNQRSAFTVVDQMSNSRHELRSNNDYNANHTQDSVQRIHTADNRCSDPSSTWEDNGNKDTNSIDSMAESSSPLSDAHSASTESNNFTMDKLIKAIEMNKLSAPDSEARYKILKWVYENNGDESLANLVNVETLFEFFPFARSEPEIDQFSVQECKMIGVVCDF